MSYSGIGRLGSYFTFRPHEVYSGLGCGCSGLGCGCSGLGGIDFSGSTVWSDWLQGQACGNPAATGAQGPACAAAKRAVDALRAALGELGYGALPMGTPWGSADRAAYSKFVSDHSLQPSAGMPAQVHMGVFEELLNRGATPGPETVVSYEKVGGEYVPSKMAAAGIGLKGLAILGVVGLAAVGGAAMLKRRKGRSRALVVASR